MVPRPQRVLLLTLQYSGNGKYSAPHIYWSTRSGAISHRAKRINESDSTLYFPSTHSVGSEVSKSAELNSSWLHQTRSTDTHGLQYTSREGTLHVLFNNVTHSLVQVVHGDSYWNEPVILNPAESVLLYYTVSACDTFPIKLQMVFSVKRVHARWQGMISECVSIQLSDHCHNNERRITNGRLFSQVLFLEALGLQGVLVDGPAVVSSSASEQSIHSNWLFCPTHGNTGTNFFR